MMEPGNLHFDDEQPGDVSQRRFEGALRGWVHRPASVPAEVDRRMAAEIESHFAAVAGRKYATWWRRPARWGMAAAVVVMGAGLAIMWTRLRGTAPNVPPRTIRMAGDMDGNQRIDILDAFSLARVLQEGGNAPGADLSGDGRIDEADVRAIAMRAVAVGGNG